MTTYESIKQDIANQNEIVSGIEIVLSGFHRGEMGLVLDSVRATPEYKAAALSFKIEFGKLQALNALKCKKFAKEMRNERKVKMAQLA